MPETMWYAYGDLKEILPIFAVVRPWKDEGRFLSHVCAEGQSVRAEGQSVTDCPSHVCAEGQSVTDCPSAQTWEGFRT